MKPSPLRGGDRMAAAPAVSKEMPVLSQAGGPPLQTVVSVVPVPNRFTIPCHRHFLTRTGIILLPKIDTNLAAV